MDSGGTPNDLVAILSGNHNKYSLVRCIFIFQVYSLYTYIKHHIGI